MKQLIYKLLLKYPKIGRIVSVIYATFGLKSQIKGKGNKIVYDRCYFKNTRIQIIGNNNIINLGSFNRLTNCYINIYGNNNVLFLGDLSYILDTEHYFEDGFNKIVVGYKTNILRAHIAITEFKRTISIGDNCSLSKNIEIRNGDSHSILYFNGKRLNYASNVTIGDRLWIATDAKILKGVTISNDSVVTNKFMQSNVIIGGFPAKVFKGNLMWGNERIYE